MRYFLVSICFFALCFAQISDFVPSLSNRVVDGANLLHVNTKKTLETMLENEENNSSNQIVIATIQSLHGYAIEDFAITIAREWKIGQKDKNNGVLLLIAPNEKKVRIEVGYGLEGALTDKISHEIITYTIAPYFKQKDYDNGVLKATSQIIRAIHGEYKANHKKTDDELVSLFSFFATMVGFGFLALSSKLRSKKMRSIGFSVFFSAFSLPITISLFGISSFAPFIIFIIIFVAIFLLTQNMKMQQFSSQNSDFDYIGGGFGDSGFSGGLSGGFSGGGGSFGGGGASGGW